MLAMVAPGCTSELSAWTKPDGGRDSGPAADAQEADDAQTGHEEPGDAQPGADEQADEQADSGAQPAGQIVDMAVSYYGWPDNDPPGDGITYYIRHEAAGGIGTYDDPVTYATREGFLPPGTIVYVPYIAKYGILEDDCASCTDDWIDLWMTSDEDSGDDVIDCEDHWWRESTPVELEPPTDRPVFTDPLFDTDTNTCLRSIP